MRLSGRKQGKLIETIAAEFEYEDLKDSVRKIGVDLRSIIGPGPMNQVAQELIADRIEKESLLNPSCSMPTETFPPVRATRVLVKVVETCSVPLMNNFIRSVTSKNSATILLGAVWKARTS